MENPLFRNYWNATRPRFSPISRPIPIRQQPKPSHSPKVVSIPVHFVGSERARSEAAVKIQKAFRGFVVRKNVKEIVKIRSEVDEIGRKVSQKEAADLIGRNAKERLRVNEMLMSLLFRLDSIRGVDSAVRNCRKAVIRKVILLQEAVDAIVVAADAEKAEKKETMADQTIPTTDPAALSGNCETLVDSVDQALEIPHDSESALESAAEQTLEMQDPVESPAVNAQTLETLQDPVGPETPHIHDPAGSEIDIRNPSIPVDDPALDTQESNESKDNSAPTLENKEDAMEEILEKTGLLPSASQGEEVEESQPKENAKFRNEMEIQGCCDKRCEENTRAERMMEENEKLKGLVTELCERDAMQSRMMNGLLQRLEQLERAVTRSERMRRRKKRHAAKIERDVERRKCERRF